jgi:hypothetical protein
MPLSEVIMLLSPVWLYHNPTFRPEHPFAPPGARFYKAFQIFVIAGIAADSV